VSIFIQEIEFFSHLVLMTLKKRFIIFTRFFYHLLRLLQDKLLFFVDQYRVFISPLLILGRVVSFLSKCCIVLIFFCYSRRSFDSTHFHFHADAVEIGILFLRFLSRTLSLSIDIQGLVENAAHIIVFPAHRDGLFSLRLLLYFAL